ARSDDALERDTALCEKGTELRFGVFAPSDPDEHHEVEGLAGVGRVSRIAGTLAAPAIADRTVAVLGLSKRSTRRSARRWPTVSRDGTDEPQPAKRQTGTCCERRARL